MNKQNLYLGRWKAGEVSIRKMELLWQYIMKCEIKKNPYFSRYSSCVRVRNSSTSRQMQIREITDFFFQLCLWSHYNNGCKKTYDYRNPIMSAMPVIVMVFHWSTFSKRLHRIALFCLCKSRTVHFSWTGRLSRNTFCKPCASARRQSQLTHNLS